MQRLFALGVALQVACSGSGDGGGTMTEANPPGSPAGPPPATAEVQMRSDDDGYGTTSHAFLPTTVSVRRAGTVTWTNNTGVTHNVTFDAVAGAPDNIPQFSSGSESRTFATAGSFAYACTLHPGMTGTVSVAN